MSLIWMPPQDDDAAFVDGAQRTRHQRAHGGEDQWCVQRYRCVEVAGARPACASLVCQLLGGAVARAGEGIDLPALRHGDLHHQVGHRAEAVDADAVR